MSTPSGDRMMSPRRGDVASSVSPTAHESAPQGHAGHTQHTRNISVNIEAITDLIKRFNEEQTRNEAALAQNHRSSAPADGPTMRASPDLGSDEPSGTLQPSAHILPPAAPASPVPVPIQQTRSGRISRPPPPTPALSARASPLRFQLSPRAGFVHDGGSTGSGGASLSIDSIASSHLAILRNLMGSSNARYAAGMNGVEAGGEGGSADATTSEIAVVQPLQNQAQAQARYSVAPVPAAPAPPAPLPPANRRSRKRRHSDDEDEDDSPEATTPEAGSTRLAVSPKTEARRAKNKYSARQSRMKKEAMVQDMKDRIASLEDELEMSRAKYQVLSQQHVQLQDRYVSLSQAVQAAGYATAPVQAGPIYPQPTNQYYSSLAAASHGDTKAQSDLRHSSSHPPNQYPDSIAAPPPASPLREMTQQPSDGLLDFDNAADQPWSSTLFDFLNTDFDDKEEEDTDYKPSSPVDAGGASALPSPAEETPQAAEQAGMDNITPTEPTATLEADVDTTLQEAGEIAERRGRSATGRAGSVETPGNDEEEDDDDDDSDEDMNYNEEEWEDDGLFLPIEDVPIPEEIKAVHQAAVPVEEDHPMFPPASTSGAAATAAPQSADPPTTGFMDHLAAVVNNPDGLAALRAILGNGAGQATQPDRGYGIGRGAPAQDPAALLRQVFIMNQNQQRSTTRR